MASAPALPPPLTLTPIGDREVVEEPRAKEIISAWKDQIAAHTEQVESAIAESDGSVNIRDVVLVEKIDLSDKSYTAAAAVQVAHFLTEGNPSLASQITKADLSDVIASRMEEEGLQVLQTLCDAFHESSLIEVDLSENAMGSKGIKACNTVLAGQSGSLERLSLCNNGLSAASMNEVADILTGGTEDADDDANDDGCICERLTKLHFFNNMSGDGGCEAFARILSKCTPSLKDVRFSGTRAGRDGSLYIASALDGLGEERIQNLERLDLADNSFGSEGAEMLSRALQYCVSLQYLNVRDCVLEDSGAGKVCRALWSADAPLVHLDLSGNEITKRGARSLADLLEENATLKVLHVEENELTSLGVKSIARALYKEGEDEGANSNVNESIEEIKLGTNECGRIGAVALIDAYGPGGEGMPNLKLIALDENKFPDDVVDALEKSFGDKLVEMEDNDGEDDIDEELDEEEEDDDEEDAGIDEGGNGGDAGNQEDADVNQLANSISEGLQIDGLC